MGESERRWCWWPCIGCATVRAWQLREAADWCSFEEPTWRALGVVVRAALLSAGSMVAAGLRVLVDLWRDTPNRCGFGGETWRILDDPEKR